MDAGKLRQRVTIQAPAQSQDATTGELTTAWVDIHTRIYAAVEPLSVKEFLQSQADQSEVSARITIRYRSGLTPDMRILYRDKVYNPAGFLEDKDSGIEYITIPCKEGVNDG
jgi:SPP1 family predicted phage head-tail adaptor